MGIASQDAVMELKLMIDQVDEQFQRTFENMHQGYPCETLVRFLKAREWNVRKAYNMLVDCFKWRIANDVDNILSKPIVPKELYQAIRDSQLIGLSGYSKKGLPVLAIGVGQSTFDKATVNHYVQSHIQINEYRDHVVLPAVTKDRGRHIGTCLKVLDMTGLKLSALNQIKLCTIISTVDDLNYPEKTDTYYIVNVPYIFSACWKVVKPLLQERTRKKIEVLEGSGRDELLKVMDYESLPHFCRRDGSGSSRRGTLASGNCYSLDHTFHQELYNYTLRELPYMQVAKPIKQGSFHIDLPESDLKGNKLTQMMETEFHKFEGRPGMLDNIKIYGVGV